MKLKLFISILSIFICTTIIAQPTNIEIYQGGVDEPSIMINPFNLNEIVAASNINHYFYSNDGGYNWGEGSLTSTYGVWGDPCIIIDNNENFYFFHLSNPNKDSFSMIDRMVCQKSMDAGKSWNNGSFSGLNGDKVQDKEWAVYDRRNEIIYLTWTQFDVYADWYPWKLQPTDSTLILFSKSLDHGKTWSNPIRLSDQAGDCYDDDYAVEGSVPTVGPNGEIYVCWAGPAGLMFDKSYDFGETWLKKDIFISDIPGGWNFDVDGISRCNGLPIIICDTSEGPNRGNIYINWSDQRNGTYDTDIWLKKSSDGGETWSDLIRVNNDPPGKQQFLTWMAIDQTTGYLYFVFYDRRNYDDLNTDVFLAVSKDGGESFQNYQISEAPFIPDKNVFFGDYNNISAHAIMVRPIWTRMVNGKKSIVTALVDPDKLSLDQVPIPFLTQNQFPNPFNVSTFFSFKLISSELVSLVVVDIFGNEIVKIIDKEYLEPGKYTYEFNAQNYKLSPGIYFFNLKSKYKNISSKIVYFK